MPLHFPHFGPAESFSAGSLFMPAHAGQTICIALLMLSVYQEIGMQQNRRHSTVVALAG
jgi:hypothetical protein